MITAQPIAPSTVHPAQASPQTDPSSRGEGNLQVLNKDASRFVSDMAEEIGTSVSSNSRKKQLTPRREGEDRHAKDIEQKAQAFIADKKFDQNKRALEDLVKDPALTKQLLIDEVSRVTQSAVEAFALLQHIKKEAQQGVLTILDSFQDDLMSRHRRAILAELNTFKISVTYARKFSTESPENLRETYLQATSNYDGIFAIYQVLQSKVDADSFPLWLQFFRDAATADLCSFQSSSDKQALFSIITELKNIRVFGTFLTLCDGFIRRLKKRYGESEKLKFERVISLIFRKLRKPYSTSKDFSELSDFHANAATSDTVYFAHQMRALFSEMPDDFFKSGDKRADLLSEFQKFLDEQIMQEEAAL